MNQTTNTEGYKKGCWDPHTTGLSGSTWILTKRSGVSVPVRHGGIQLRLVQQADAPRPTWPHSPATWYSLL